MQIKKPRQYLLLFVSALLVLLISLLSHLQIAFIADKWIDKNSISPLLFSEWQGGLGSGSANVALQSKQGNSPLGRVYWRNDLLNWLLLQPTMHSSVRSTDSRLQIEGSYSILNQLLVIRVRDSALSSAGLKAFWQLNREYGRWLNGIEGKLQQLNLQIDWDQSKQWLAALTGSAQLVGLQFMGETFPAIQLQVLQQQQNIVLQIQAQENWKLQGSITFQPVFSDTRQLIAMQYDGAIEVQAESAEALPNWASLMQAQGDRAAISKLTGQLSLK